MKPLLTFILTFILTLFMFLPSTLAWGMEELHILSSDRITPPDLVERFERERGLRVRFEYFESPAALAAYLETRPRGDLALLRGYHVGRLVENSQLSPLDHQLLPNLKNLGGEMSSTIDPEYQYALPYLLGTMGIVYRTDLLDGPPPAWSWIFDRFAGSASFASTNQYRDAMGVALRELGYSYNSTSPVAIGQAAEVLRNLTNHPAFMGFLDPAGTLRFLREKFIYAAVTYNNLAAEAMEGDPGLSFDIPADGGVAWSYVYVLNSQSQRTEAAHQWLNFLMEPEVAAHIATWNRATSPNHAARTLLPPEIISNPVLYPPLEIWRACETAKSVDVESEKLYVQFWSQIMMK